MGQLQSGCFFIEPLVGSFLRQKRLSSPDCLKFCVTILHDLAYFFAKVISEDEKFEQRVGITNYILF